MPMRVMGILFSLEIFVSGKCSAILLVVGTEGDSKISEMQAKWTNSESQYSFYLSGVPDSRHISGLIHLHLS